MDAATALRGFVIEWTTGWRLGVTVPGVAMLLMAMILLWRPASRDLHKRGAKILAGRRARRKARQLRRASGEASLHLGGVRLAALDETKHFKLIGTTGTGKSTAIRELLGSALEREIGLSSPIPTVAISGASTTAIGAMSSSILSRGMP